jgi:sigma-B regulation protein RsbU (phosphoserine phosphatase)
LKGSGVALGVNGDFDYKENSIGGLANGQIIAVGTDGIWEAVNSQGEMFGKERFRHIIKRNARAGSSDIVSAVYNELNQFTRGRKSEDDITLVIIKVDGL